MVMARLTDLDTMQERRWKRWKDAGAGAGAGAVVLTTKVFDEE
jgi:hypothetical protein